MPETSNKSSAERQWAYELWVHLSDHVNQRCETDEPPDCQHCNDAEVNCDDCFKLLRDWEASLDPDGDGYLRLPDTTHQRRSAALEYIYRSVHPIGETSTCAGLPYCHGCIAREALGA